MFAVGTGFVEAVGKGGKGFGRDFGIGEDLFEQGCCLVHVLAKTADYGVRPFCTNLEAVVAGEFVEFVLDLLGCHVGCAYKAHQFGCIVQKAVDLAAGFVYIYQGEDVVGLVGYIQHFYAVLGFEACEVAVEVEEYRLDRFYLRVRMSVGNCDALSRFISIGVSWGLASLSSLGSWPWRL